MDVASPPQYRRFSSRPGQVPQSGSELPPYTRRRRETVSELPPREPTEHVYQLMNGKNKPWASMKVLSSAKSSKSLPTFFEREAVAGSLELNLEKGDSIQAITVSVTGRIITGAGSGDCYTFLDTTLPMWSKSSGDSRVPSPPGAAGSSKLHGNYKWPFSIPLPKVVGVPSGSGEAPQLCRLPETFMERHSRAGVQYDLTLRIARGKLRADNLITTPFAYIPSTRPDPPSMLRQLAYQESCPLPGPAADPEGWKTFRPVTSRGVIFNARRVEAKCTFSIARPLCYTRGTVIPCTLSIEGRDTQALDLLASNKSIVVCLRRRVRYYNSLSPHNRPEVAWKDSIDDVGRAVWWPSVDGRSGPHARHLEGEIALAKDMKPSSSIAHFSISYSVVVCPFDATGFASSDTEPLLAEPVEIATMHAKGPRPKAYAPPAYAPASRRESNDFYAAPPGVMWNGR